MFTKSHLIAIFMFSSSGQQIGSRQPGIFDEYSAPVCPTAHRCVWLVVPNPMWAKVLCAGACGGGCTGSATVRFYLAGKAGRAGSPTAPTLVRLRHHPPRSLV